MDNCVILNLWREIVMIHIILDQKNNKGLVNIVGGRNEVRKDFSILFEKLYEASPDMFLELTEVLNIFAEHIVEEELKKNDQNDSSNKS